jgi:hypothetical protein
MLDELPVDFEPSLYFRLHRDVAASGIDAATHYLMYGRHEGRRYRPRDLADRTYDADGLATIHNADFQGDPAFVRAYARGVQAAESDYGWRWRVHVGLWAASSAIRLPGDFVECGVNRGFLSSAIMEHLDWATRGRTFYLLDTFSGIDPRYISDAERKNGILRTNEAAIACGFYTTHVERVRANFRQWPNVEIVEGPVPETLDRITSTQVAFVHVDMNCAPPEVAAIEYLWPKLAPGALVLLDDYGYQRHELQKEAMDALAIRLQVSILSLPTGQGLIIRPPGG